ncbi:MAG: TfoX/Sxy family protein [Candidatus Roizmanbacteria bacterium]|nr:TfoX/Sxy family protein [Candidatus Roizmanbacteria bacterium]
MSTKKDTILFILKKLGNTSRFTTRAMFGEYALYADNKVVGLVCDDLLYVKNCSASSFLEKTCEKDSPYPGAKLYYVVDEEKLDMLVALPNILLMIAKSLPTKHKQIENR